jgi:c-di-GMP-binding flagellar brake protein YcgR
VPNEKEKTNLFSSAGKDDFWMRARSDVISVLTQLAKRPTTITAYFNGKQDFILTAVLGLLPERNLLVLDEGPSDKRNAQLLQSGRVSCVTVHDHIRIRFECVNLVRARYKGRGVIVCPIPSAVFYLQRRESFRIATSVLTPPLCYVPLSDQDDPLELVVVDISASGVGLHDLETRLTLDPLTPALFRGCTLYLPDFAELTVNLQFRNHRREVRKDGREVQRIGAMFVDMRPGTGNHVQQYVNRLQLKQIALSRQ